MAIFHAATRVRPADVTRRLGRCAVDPVIVGLNSISGSEQCIFDVQHGNFCQLNVDENVGVACNASYSHHCTRGAHRCRDFAVLQPSRAPSQFAPCCTFTLSYTVSRRIVVAAHGMVIGASSAAARCGRHRQQLVSAATAVVAASAKRRAALLSYPSPRQAP